MEILKNRRWTLPAAAGLSVTGLLWAATAEGNFTGHVKPVLYVSDVERSGEFYRDVLGFAHHGYAHLKGEPYYADMAAGPQLFGLHEPTAEGDEDRIGRQILYFRVMDLNRHRQRVEQAGGKPGPVRETAWMDIFEVVDPDGNKIRFAVTDPQRHSQQPWTTVEEP